LSRDDCLLFSPPRMLAMAAVDVVAVVVGKGRTPRFLTSVTRGALGERE
jgi:hypothetical protein